MRARVEVVKTRFMSFALVILLSACGGDTQDKVSVSPRDKEMQAATETVSSTAPGTEDPSQGRDVYGHYCAGCHDAGQGHPGTMQLAARSGAERSVLLSRTDLSPEFVINIVRNGLQMMPPFRPTEITDPELAALAQYVAGANE